jgi:hypothetical protein
MTQSVRCAQNLLAGSSDNLTKTVPWLERLGFIKDLWYLVEQLGMRRQQLVAFARPSSVRCRKIEALSVPRRGSMLVSEDTADRELINRNRSAESMHRARTRSLWIFIHYELSIPEKFSLCTWLNGPKLAEDGHIQDKSEKLPKVRRFEKSQKQSGYSLSQATC